MSSASIQNAIQNAWQADGPPDDDMSDRWGEIVSATHLPWQVQVQVPVQGGRFRADVQRWWIDDLALVDVRCGPSSGHRRRSQLAATDGEFVVVLFTRSGRETVWTDERQVVLGPGDAVVWDSGIHARFQIPDHLVKRSLLIPRAVLDEVSGQTWTTPGVRLDGASPAVRLLSSYLDSLTGMLPQLGPTALIAARNATLELFVGAARPAGAGTVPVSTVTDPALRAAMDRYIDRHLAGGLLSPGDIAQAHGVSVRTVNRIYSSSGETVSGVIRSRRLARARAELAAGTEPIMTIAHRWGFFDSSHFTRTFKSQYGISPREYRAATV